MKLYIDNDQKFATETLLIFLLPVLLIYYGVISHTQRLPLLVLVVLSVFLIIKREKWKLEDMGIHLNKFGSGLFYYASFTAIGFLGLVYYSFLVNKGSVPSFSINPYLLLSFIPISFFQEFLYRGFMMKMLSSVFHERMTIVLINSALFTVLHIIYPLPLFMLPLAFISGLYFSVIYTYIPNLFLVSVSHAILNLVAVGLGFFVIS
ncbi:CPBP family intramembrane metalloprotease [Candidatus Nomurabacteria bacterium]|nr:CPBP family intramembrane metalloprotease [Candidatus Nomurabacteria bacterium]USN95121.1 MAG: CPBP family intramembrane metalloprotease [Candidatus Nomurabacteria bacterium]